jgi:UDP-N-acetyl-D-mannosaminuronate dehydrogenase
MPVEKPGIESLQINHDYVLYWSKSNKRHYLTLGYFGGGAIKITDANKWAQKFCDVLGYPIDSIMIDEVKTSRHIKEFKVIWSDVEGQTPVEGATEVEDFWSYANS